MRVENLIKSTTVVRLHAYRRLLFFFSRPERDTLITFIKPQMNFVLKLCCTYIFRGFSGTPLNIKTQTECRLLIS